VNETASLLEITAWFSFFGAALFGFGRLAGGGDGITLTDVFARPADPPLPRGVQEEEPVRWRLEALRPRRAIERQPQAARPRPAAGLEVDPGRCA
jgi:hypothetical protein